MNLGEIVSHVRLRCGISATDTDMDGYIRSMANAEYFRLCGEYRLVDKVTTVTLVKDSPVVDLPDDWQKTHQLRYGSQIIQPVTALDYMQRKTNNDYSEFVYLPESPERVRVWPVPTKTEPNAVDIAYAARPHAMVNNTDEPFSIPLAYQIILPALVSYHVLMAEESLDLAQAAQVEAQTLESRMAGHIVMREGQGNDKIVPPPAMVGRK